MPRNWWELFPEIVPSPAARSRPMPMLGRAMQAQLDVMPVPITGAQSGWLGGMQDVPQAPFDDFNPSYSSGGEFADDYNPDLMTAQPPPSGARTGPPMNRNAAVLQAAATIRRGADPKAVRSRLNEMRFRSADLPLSGSFSDLVPSDRQGALDGQVPAQPSTVPQPFGPAQTPLQHRLMSYLRDAKPTTRGKFNKPAADAKSVRMAAASQLDQPPDDPFTPEDPLTHMMATDERALQTNPARADNSSNHPAQEHTNRQARLRHANEQALDDPRVLAFLDTIASAEGANYNTMFGNRTFSDMRTHPGQVGARFLGHPQSAAGRYQIQRPNFDERVSRMGPLDMTPGSQDLMAADILSRYGGLDALQANDLASAVSNLSGQWASFPRRVNGVWTGSRYRHQTAIPIEVLTAFYNEALRYYSAPSSIPPRNRPHLWVNLRGVRHRTASAHD